MATSQLSECPPYLVASPRNPPQHGWLCSFRRIRRQAFIPAGSLSWAVALGCSPHQDVRGRPGHRQVLPWRSPGRGPQPTGLCVFIPEGSGSSCFPTSGCPRPAPYVLSPVPPRSHNPHPLSPGGPCTARLFLQTLSGTWARGDVPLAHMRGGDFHEAWLP